ncbi:MAG: hypothetical protein A2234_05950 [Elusimicrobia bacterium RIFOXYA2_FULL_58_8]|nr:MAG: hypothetical protein A2285_06605 [Elusimicrobia bacterium RIFOXYA12_FULL_57_11]OGS12819.1 MAG: hypothetical protein A2234_05950 [Elusimicrobia bacterium RIFOXYA2_FULL_58_8]
MNHCPKCPSETLVESKALGDMALDRCPGCGGIWFDKGELEALLKQSQGQVSADFDLIMPKPAERDCPRCSKKMWSGGLVNPLLLVDKCSDCGGVWLDPRELVLAKKMLGLTGGPDAENIAPVERPLQVPARRAAPAAPHSKIIPLACALLGFIGLVYQARVYLEAMEKPSHLGFFAVVLVSILLFSGGLFALLHNVSDGRDAD